MTLQKIISGGQTGVDRAALDAARAQNLAVGGWCPKGRRAEDGSIPSVYPLKEAPSAAYQQRTSWNVRDSDGTLLLTRGALEGGTAFTKSEADERGRPVLHVSTSHSEPVPTIRAWVTEYDIETLNVAGPRASEEPGIYDDAYAIVRSLLDKMSD